jgi:hypothetical protein
VIILRRTAETQRKKSVVNLRAAEFEQRCRQLGIKGVTLHSYPERFAQEALGHNSKAVHRAYAKRALMKIPSLEDYEQPVRTAKPESFLIHK